MENQKKLDKLDYKLVFKTVDKMPLSRKIKPLNLSLFSDYNPKTTTQGLEYQNLNKVLKIRKSLIHNRYYKK